MTRVAAFDCGTNSLRLLIADVVDGSVHDIVRENRIVRLGQGVDATGEFTPEALERTFAVCDEYAQLAAQHSPELLRFVGTSASRDARNRDAYFSGVLERLGTPVEVIEGSEEAALSFRGAVSGVAGPDTQSPYLVMDLGGGSTELVLGSDTDGVEQAHSMDIGCVRLTERHLQGDPPTADEIGRALADVDAAFAEATTAVDVTRARTLVGVAGTITTLTAAFLELPAYDPAAIHGTRLDAAGLHRTADSLVGMSRAERAALPFMHPGRVDVIGAGALVYSRLVEHITRGVKEAGGELRVVTSETDILDGIALGLAGGPA